MIPYVSLNTRADTVSGALHSPEPISFDFDEMIKAKAQADAEIKAEIERRIIESILSIGKGYRRIPCYESTTEKRAPTDEVFSEYVYDYNPVAELMALKRKKYGK